MDKIIQKAIEGGYGKEYDRVTYKSSIKLVSLISLDHEWDGTTKSVKQISIYEVLCDPLFWQALGKACEWTETENIKVWKFNAHEFYDINLTQGFDKAVSYLQELISN